MSKKKYSKLRILIFFAFSMVAIILIIDLYRLIDSGIKTIRTGRENFRCTHIDYDVEAMEKDGGILVEITSRDYDTKISNITVIYYGREYSEEINPALEGGKKKFILFKELRKNEVDDNVSVYVNGCKNKVRYLKIK